MSGSQAGDVACWAHPSQEGLGWVVPWYRDHCAVIASPKSPSLRTTMWNSPIYLLLWTSGNLLSLIGVLTNDCSIANSFTTRCHAKTNASLETGNKTRCLMCSHCEPHWFCMLYHIMHAILLTRFSISKKNCIKQKLNPNPSLRIFPSSCRICFPFSHSSLCRDLC